ncbi:exodeoxyribonuclease V, alpha subunit [Leptothrix cholodnii SP-6]|uniref:RecBCD enzyme subunit RecD n=1 Tax=Leptothrix cholodnii (strain ATCC 51168 / LMG 8142 / SP-6) TaxID=395495 RepID=B1XZ26_LEPCP|nr:exodeoxyribonuclease V subunit alpha [Leptothrix cholodnii]ACB34045.1 exodeoxyribonuclease V, alpha subunit [Leptothrix cholodnii SP-6]
MSPHVPDGQVDLFGPVSGQLPGHPTGEPAEPGDAPSPSAVLAELAAWAEAGWLRALDLSLARLLVQQCPDASAHLALAAALLAHNEGRGHTCLPLDEWLASVDEAAAPTAPGGSHARPLTEPWLDGPADAQAALARQLRALGTDPGEWRAALLCSGAVAAAGEIVATGLASPLILSGSRLYLRRHFRDEQAVAQAVVGRAAAAMPVAEGAPQAQPHAGTEPPDAAQVRLWLDRLFGGPPAPDRFDWQRSACAIALRGRLALITGGPGTGKTYTVARLLALVMAVHPQPQALRIALAAPTGKAAARLKQSIDSALQQLAAALPGALDWGLLQQRLSQSLTLHKLLGARPDTRRFGRDARHPLEVDLLVVDEASMVHLEMMAALLAALPPASRLVLLGDKDQLASVEAGAVLGDLCVDAAAGGYDEDTAAWIQACVGQALPQPFRCGQPGPLAQQTVMLRESRRFEGPIGALALAVNAGDVTAARRLLGLGVPAPADDGSLRAPTGVTPAAVCDLAVHGRAGNDASATGFVNYLRLLREGAPRRADGPSPDGVRAVLQAFERCRVLCAVREGEWGVAGLNAAIERQLRQQGWIARQGEWYEGRPVMVTRNDPALGVFNGDIGLALRGPAQPGGAQGAGGPLRVWFLDGEQPRSVLASRLAAVETAYAMTVHKSQGSEFEHTVLVLPPHANPVLTRELVYTGITRARRAFTLVAPEPAVFDLALQRRTRRASGLPDLLAAGA